VSAEEACKLMSEMINVPERTHTINVPSSNAASDTPIIAKLLVAAKLEFRPPVVIKRYNAAVTISQKINRYNK
jgi:hypothetical protein